ncbi:hypothetical protein GCM10022215_06850 [Nocardioides fonticola]|uniref:DUF3180 domain-containing protein n=1 Tax=Nocardioides fonticola TaxID=450363 RepID=A0ABP7XCK0_9ACTN
MRGELPPPTPEPSGEDPEGTIRPASPWGATLCVVLGLVAGWGYGRIAEATDTTAPVPSWAQPVTLAFFAVAIALTARQTHRWLQVHREPMEAHRAVNRLALGRAAVYVGSLIGGAYGGYAVSWLGLSAELADQRAIRSGLAALAALGIVVAGFFLERACRVRGDDEES